MSLRTPSTTQTRQALLDLQRTKERLATNQAQITSGKRLASPGDDPAGAAAILSFGTSIQSNTQFIKQANSAMSYLTSTEDVVSSALGSISSLMELAVSGSAASAPGVDAIKANLLALANTNQQGKYLFAGTKTQTTPFTDPGSGVITYGGDAAAAGKIMLDVGGSNSAISPISVQTNVTGDTVFGATGSPLDVFKAVTELSNALSNPAAVPPLSSFTGPGGTLQKIFDNLNSVLSDLGGRQSGLMNMKDMLSGFNVTLQGLQNTQQDTDYPQAITDFMSDQTVQSASLSAMAKTTRTNLFDYMG